MTSTNYEERYQESIKKIGTLRMLNLPEQVKRF